MNKKRCSWVTENSLYIKYHDEEWGRPVYDDQHLFEMITLEGAQAGLNWLTILKRRENYRKAFDHFCIEKISHYDEQKIAHLLADKGIIRNKLKIRSEEQRLNSSHVAISYAVFCLKKKNRS